MKICKSCGQSRSVDEFNRYKNSKDGLYPICKLCVKERNGKYYEENKQKLSDYHKEYVKNNGEKISALNKAYYESNLKAIKKRASNWRRENADKAKAAIKKWTKENMDKVYVYKRNRRAKASGVGGKHTKDDIKMLLELQKNKCACCNTKLNKYHVDHKEPIALGGSNDKHNLQILCPTCNLTKNAKDPYEFMQSMGFLL